MDNESGRQLCDVLLQEKGGIRLDIGCGANKQPGFVGLDIQDLPGVDIKWDWLHIPWPLPDACVVQAIASHVVEHIPKVAIEHGDTRWPFLEFMDEVWRVLKVGCQFAIAVPYCISPGFYQDPTHINPISERTWLYFDPKSADGVFYAFYKPKPWHISYISWDPAANLEVLLTKLEAV